jgi:hypothetical protein
MACQAPGSLLPMFADAAELTRTERWQRLAKLRAYWKSGYNEPTCTERELALIHSSSPKREILNSSAAIERHQAERPVTPDRQIRRSRSFTRIAPPKMSVRQPTSMISPIPRIRTRRGARDSHE